MSQRSTPRRLLYRVLQVFTRLVAVVVFRFRAFDREHMPRDGAVLVCANHQSYLDPVIVGITLNRRLNFLARKSLFRFGPFALLIHLLDAIPLERDGMGLGGLKESLRRLKRGEMVLIFPEGTRTADGEVAPLKPGFCVLARRGGVALLPVGIDGAFQAWPRSSLLPKRSPIHVCVGEPIQPELVEGLDDEGLVAELERRMRDCHERARMGRRHVEFQTRNFEG